MQSTSLKQILPDNFDMIIDALHDGVSIVDETGKVIRINSGMTRITGLPPEVFLQQPALSLYERGYFAEIPIAYQALKERKTKHGIQRINTGKSVMITAVPVLKSRKVHFVVVDAKDISKLEGFKEGLKKIEGQSYRNCDSGNAFIENKIIFRSAKMHSVLDKTMRVAKTDATVLLLGESGVGKDILAEIIHKASARSEQGTFLRINCNTVTEGLLESELFGYERGAFTGARDSGKPGLLEMVKGGTLFLDEIGDLAPQLQGKFLDVLERNQFRRVGGSQMISLDARIVCATNQNLIELIEKGLFRSDLYFRLSVVPIEIPPLRDRQEDIMALVGFYLDRFNDKYKVHKHLCSETLQLLREKDWPGNVRELINLLERLVITTPGNLIKPQDISQECYVHRRELSIEPPCTLRDSLEELEKSILSRAKLEYSSSRQIGKALGLSHVTVQNKLKKYGIGKVVRNVSKW